MQLELPQRNRKRLVSMTPLIDVVFILLLFFMLASNFNRWQTTPLELGGASAEQNSPQPNLHLQINVNGALVFRGKPLALQTLEKIVDDATQGDTLPSVQIISGTGVTLQTLTHLLDRLTALGITQINLVGG